jgi:mannan endo-1,4-beta-mannosidase
LTILPPEQPAVTGPRHMAPAKPRGVTHLVFTSDLPGDQGAKAVPGGKIILVNSTWAKGARRRAAVRAEMHGSRLGGLLVFPMLGSARVRRALYDAMQALSSFAVHAGTLISPDNPVIAFTTAAIIGTAAVSGTVGVATGIIPVTPFTSALHSATGTGPPEPVYAHLRPFPASYLGVYEATSPGSYGGVTAFGRTIGHTPNLALYYSGWGEPFQAGFAEQALAAGATPVVQINPDNGTSLAAIADGSWDPYLIRYAQAVHAYGHNVVLSFGHEMNGDWYSWGYTHARPGTFIAAWQHIVTVFRAEGDFNVTWMWTVNASAHSTSPIAEWYPGSQYVTWVATDSYYYTARATFASVFGATINQLQATAPGKPVLIAETASDPPEQPEARQITGLFDGIRDHQILGFIWYDEPGHTGLAWRIEGNPPAIAAFRASAKGWGG